MTVTSSFLAQRPILIIGAGISGLAAARLLTHAGVPSIVFEAAPEDRGQGYSITLREWAYKALLTDLGESSVKILENAVAPDRYVGGTGWVDGALRDNSTGEVLMAPETSPKDSTERKMFRANRNALRNWLATGQDPQVDMRHGYRLKNLRGQMGDVEAEFENGERVRGSMIIASDGVHSSVREQILPQIKPAILPVVVYHGEFTLSHKDFEEILKPSMGDSNVFAGVGDGFNTPITLSSVNEHGVDLDWSYSRAASPRSDCLFRPNRTNEEAHLIPAALLEELSSRNLVPPFSTFFNAEQVQTNEVYNWLSRSVFISRKGLDQGVEQGVIFIGDAAHAMPIFGGEGGNHALLDGVELAKMLVDSEIHTKAAGSERGVELEDFAHGFYDGAHKRWHDAVKRTRQRFHTLHRPIAEWRKISEQQKMMKQTET